jgi:hypothetical protein
MPGGVGGARSGILTAPIPIMSRNDHLYGTPDLPCKHRKVFFWRAPCKGGVSQWVRIPPGEFAPAGSHRSSNGGNEVADAFHVEGR